jgi:hypothetical protein
MTTNTQQGTEPTQQEPTGMKIAPEHKEILEKVDAGELPGTALDDLPDEVTDHILEGDGQFITDDDPDLSEDSNPNGTEETATNTPNSLKEDTDDDLGLRYREAADKANTYEQRFASAQNKLESLEEKLNDPEFLQSKLKSLKPEEQIAEEFGEFSEEMFKPPVDEDGDPDFFDHDYQKRVAEGLQKFAKFQNNLKEREVTRAQNERQQAEVQQASAKIQKAQQEIESFQSEVPELKTERPFMEIDREFTDFKRKLGSQEALDRYFSDESFRNQKKAEGVVPPNETDKYLRVMEIYHSRSDYPSMRAAYRDSKYFDAQLAGRSEGSQQSQSDQGVSFADRFASAMNGSTMDQGSSGKEGQGGFSEAEDMAFLESIAGEEAFMTEEQERRYDEIMARMDQKMNQ